MLRLLSNERKQNLTKISRHQFELELRVGPHVAVLVGKNLVCRIYLEPWERFQIHNFVELNFLKQPSSWKMDSKMAPKHFKPTKAVFTVQYPVKCQWYFLTLRTKRVGDCPRCTSGSQPSKIKKQYATRLQTKLRKWDLHTTGWSFPSNLKLRLKLGQFCTPGAKQ